MMALRTRIGIRRYKLAALLAIAAVLLRCAIAPGLMLDPSAASRGAFKLVICTPAGAKSISVTPDEQPVPGQQVATDTCPYASPGHMGALADPGLLIGERLSSAREAAARIPVLASARIRSFAARAPPTLI